jgi:hypothetical protein
VSGIARPRDVQAAVERAAQASTPRPRRVDAHAGERPVEMHVGDVHDSHGHAVGMNRVDLTDRAGFHSRDLRPRLLHRGDRTASVAVNVQRQPSGIADHHHMA